VRFDPWTVATGPPAGGERPQAAGPLRLEAQPSPGGLSLRLALAEPGAARLAVYDLSGRRVALLLDGEQPAGERRLGWDGRDARGRPAAAGIYLLRLESGASATVARGLLIR